jgi:hypothetical protein
MDHENLDYELEYELTEEEIELLKKEILEEVITKGLVINNFIYDGAGRKYTLDSWINRALRISIANDLFDNTISLGKEVFQEEYLISAVSDCSNLCIKYQNNVYSTNVNSKYPLLDNILFKNGGGLLHPNCRHIIDPYFEGLTEKWDVPSESTIKKNSDNRAEWMKCNNNYKKYSKIAEEQEKIGIDNSKYKSKANEWLKRRELLPNPNDSAFDM